MLQINNLSAKIATHRELIIASIDQVISSAYFVLGPEVRHFEQSFANYLGANHCVSLANGTDVIELGLRSIGVRAGDQVALVANAGMYATTAILAIGAEPYFIDVDIHTKVAKFEVG